jgi:hypothetical protein
MGEWIVISYALGVAILATLLAAVGALASAPPQAVRARLWQQAAAASTLDFWRAFQAEVMAEVARAPRLAPPPMGPPNPNSVIPPLYLYHGTRRENMASIFARGLEGRSGGWVFMARDYETARSYGSRWGGDYVVFRVFAQKAYQNGVRFEKRGGYYVARYVHPVFIDFHWALADLAHRYGMGV